MRNSESALLIDQTSPISLMQWDEIIRDLVMFSDVVWLHKPAVSFDSKLDVGLQRHFEYVYNELAEAGLIRFYAYESDEITDIGSVSRVITREEHMELYNSVVEKVRVPSFCTLDHLQDPERTSRIVEGRNELWKYGIATLLDSEISSSYNGVHKNLSEIMYNRSINTKMANELFSAFNISSLSHLSTEEIIRLSNKGKKYRKTFQNMTVKALTNPNETVSSVVNKELREVIEKINQLANDSAGNGAVKSLILNTTLNLGGLIPFSQVVLVPLTALLCGKDLFEFLKSRRKYGFVLFMNSLKLKSLN